MNQRPELNHITRYELTNSAIGTKQIEAPIGWDIDVLDIQKSKKNFATVTKYSTNITFVLYGAELINTILYTQGFDADIILSKISVNELTGEEEVKYRVFLNGYTHEFEDGKMKISTIESELSSIIAVYDNEDVEIGRLESLDGVTLPELDKVTVALDGKQILLVSKWDYDDENPIVFQKTSVTTHIYAKAIPLDNYANSDDQAFGVFGSWDVNHTDGGGYGDGSPEYCFYSIAQKDITFNLEIDVNLDFYVGTYESPTTNGLQGFRSHLSLVKYMDNSGTGGTQHDFVSEENLADFDDGDTIANITYYGNEERTLLEGESYALVLHTLMLDSDDVGVEVHKSNIVLTEDSYYEPSQTQAVLPFELFERLLRIMTGRSDTILVSDYFGRTDLGYAEDGEGAYIGISSGFWARQFYDRDIMTSWSDAIKSYGVIRNISYSIDKSGPREYVRLEPLDYFFNNDELELDSVIDDVKISAAKDFSFSSIKIGYEKGADEYEEAVGLDEFNGQHYYTTPIKKNKQVYEKLSPYRADMTGFEFARRKQQKFFPTTDTQYDDDIFFLDLKKGTTSVLLQRKWDDDFSEKPSGIYSPETATNLRLSPKQLLQVHGWFLHNCLSRYNGKYIQHTGGIGNREMILDGVKESDNFLVNLFEKQKFINVDIKFSNETSFSLSNDLLDNINGILVFTGDDGIKYKMRLFEFSKNDYKGLLVQKK